MDGELRMRAASYRSRLLNYLGELVWQAEMCTRKLYKEGLIAHLPELVWVNIRGSLKRERSVRIVGEQPLCLIWRSGCSDDEHIVTLMGAQEVKVAVVSAMSERINDELHKVSAVVVDVGVHPRLVGKLDKLVGRVEYRFSDGLKHVGGDCLVGIFWDRSNYAIPCNLAAAEAIVKAVGKLMDEGAR